MTGARRRTPGPSTTTHAAGRAFERAGLAARVAPFALTGAIALVLGIPAIGSEDRAWLAIAAATAGMTLVLGIGLPWSRLPRWVEIVPPLLYVLAVVSLRHAGGGSLSGFGPLFLVPILWLALYGTRWQLGVALGAVTFALAIPILLVGGADYPPSEWRRLLIIVGVGATLGLIVQNLVRKVRAGEASAIAAREAAVEQRDVTEALLLAASDAVVSFDRSGTIVAANLAAATLVGRSDLVGRDLFETLVPEPQRARLRRGLTLLAAGQDVPTADARFEAELRRADGSLVPVEVVVARIEGPHGLRIHAFVRDLTTRRDAERAAREHVEDLDRLLAVARDIEHDAGADARSAICAAARDLARADFVLFYTKDGDDGHLVVTGAAGDGAPIDVVLDPQRSVASTVLETGRPIESLDLVADPRVDHALAREMGVGAAYWLPVGRDMRTLGVLVAYWRQPLAALPERTIALLGLFAAQAAAAIERADLLGRLALLARTDALTGAANRRTLDDELGVAIADARRSGRPLSIAMLDLDHFKAFNDEHGHQRGDDLLRDAVRAWRAQLRPTDTLARYGGEEFLVVLPSTDAEASVVVADRLRAALPAGVSASVGVATWDGVEEAAPFIARADAALYEAKAAGRARTVASARTKPDA